MIAHIGRMTARYIKRYQMVFDAQQAPLPTPPLPHRFFWVPWDNSLITVHADVKYRSFRHELDAKLFPTFAHYDRCLNLMNALVSGGNFLPEATWLIACKSVGGDLIYCANIQGLLFRSGAGAIQNVAVLPEFRRLGLGTALVAQCLAGFHNKGVSRVSLEVTAENDAALRIYKRLGFETVKTVYKETI